VRAADPDREIVALSGDYDFQFLIEELAVGAQFNLPYIHVVVNNAYLGLIRQAQRGFAMDYQVQLSFENINAPALGAYGVDHVAVAEGLGCKAIRVTDPREARAAFTTAREWMARYRVPVVVEFILERVTNIAMGTGSTASSNSRRCSICRSMNRRWGGECCCRCRSRKSVLDAQ
jgi:tartronate-semialdehyde synthase